MRDCIQCQTMPRRQVIAQQERRATARLSQAVDPRLRHAGRPINFADDAPLNTTRGPHQQGGRKDFDIKSFGPLALRVRNQGQGDLIVLHETLRSASRFFDIDGEHHSLLGVLQVRENLQCGQFFFARCTPSSPKIENQFFALEGFCADGLTCAVFEFSDEWLRIGRPRRFLKLCKGKMLRQREADRYEAYLQGGQGFLGQTGQQLVVHCNTLSLGQGLRQKRHALMTAIRGADDLRLVDLIKVALHGRKVGGVVMRDKQISHHFFDVARHDQALPFFHHLFPANGH